MTAPYVRPDTRAFLDFLNAMPGPKMHEIGAPAARQVYLAMRDMTDLPVGELGELVRRLGRNPVPLPHRDPVEAEDMFACRPRVTGCIKPATVVHLLLLRSAGSMGRVSLIVPAFAWRERTAVDRPGRASLRARRAGV